MGRADYVIQPVLRSEAAQQHKRRNAEQWSCDIDQHDPKERLHRHDTTPLTDTQTVPAQTPSRLAACALIIACARSSDYGTDSTDRNRCHIATPAAINRYGASIRQSESHIKAFLA